MTGFVDNLYLGNAPAGIKDPDQTNPPGGRGVGPLGRTYLFDVVPAALATNNIVTAAAIGAGGAAVLTAGAGNTIVTSNRGERAVQLDTPRNVRVTSSGNETGKTITVTGYDYLGQRMSENIAGPNATTAVGLKAFFQIVSVTIAAAPSVGNISVGTGDTIGFPFRVTDRGYIRPGWNNALAQDAGTVALADGNTATATTGDVRGTYTPSNATDGSKRLVIMMGLPAIASGPNATRIGAVGVDQNLANT